MNTLSKYNKFKPLINFSPGPAQIHPNILKNIIKKKYSVHPLEMNHRCIEFELLLKRVNKNMRTFMKIPNDFSIMWTQGGAHAQFSAVPYNLCEDINDKAKYLVNGHWSKRAFNEASHIIQPQNSLKINEDDIYLYMCSNETMNGIEIKHYPNRTILGNTKLVLDMSSDFGMKQVPWKNVDVVFASCSKNFGCSGSTITIIRKNISKNRIMPSILNWNMYKNSIYNTPNVHHIHILDIVLKYYLNETIEKIEQQTNIKSKMVYDFLDNSKVFSPKIKDIVLRSNINIPFTLEKEEEFLKYCYRNNIVGLKTENPFNEKLLRISLYNGITIENVNTLIKTMQQYENTFHNIYDL